MFARKSRFRSDVNKAYRLICEKGIIDSGELQYILDVSQGPFYRIRRALLAIFPDVVCENGYFKLKTLEKHEEQQPSSNLPLDFWGGLEPDEVKQ